MRSDSRLHFWDILPHDSGHLCDFVGMAMVEHSGCEQPIDKNAGLVFTDTWLLLVLAWPRY
jgi:hypothetical protein